MPCIYRSSLHESGIRACVAGSSWSTSVIANGYLVRMSLSRTQAHMVIRLMLLGCCCQETTEHLRPDSKGILYNTTGTRQPVAVYYISMVLELIGQWLLIIRQRPWFRYPSSVRLLLSTHSLDPCLWGKSDNPDFGPPASLSLHLASSSITPSGCVHKPSGDSVVRMWVQ